MAEYLLVNDVHLSDRPPSSCTDTYNDDLFTLLGEVNRIAEQREAGGIIYAGDIFDKKTPSRTSHATVLRLIQTARAAPCPVWAVAGNHDLCVSADSEALTDRGWRRLDQLDGTERFATLNPDGHVFEWQAPEKIFVGRFHGQMVHFEGRRVDHLVTPNHDVYVRPLAGGYRKLTWRKRRAADAPHYNYWMAAVAARSWAGTADAKVTIPATGRRRSSPLEIPVLLAARFFGWYLSEGSVEPTRVTISQSLQANPVHYQEIVDLVKEMGLVPRLGPKMVRICSSALAEFLEHEFGNGSHEIRVPAWVKAWPADLLGVMVAAYLRGDGTRNGRTAWAARTASTQLADDLQEIGAKIGFGVTISRRKTFPVGDSGSVGTAVCLGITERTEVTLYAPKSVPYSGVVWCPSVPNGIWMVRRNGRALWTGNSHDRLESLAEGQPLGVVFASGAIWELSGWMDIAPIYGLPWLGTWDDDTVQAALKPYTENNRYGDAGPSLVVTHAPLYPPGQELKYEFYPAAAFADAMGNHGKVHYGHVHDPHGIYGVNNVFFSNPGALSRGSLHEHNLTRAVQIACWDSDTGNFEHLNVSHKPAGEVFRIDEVGAIKNATQRLDQFVNAVGTTSLQAVTREGVIEHIRNLGLARDVQTLAVELLTASGA